MITLVGIKATADEEYDQGMITIMIKRFIVLKIYIVFILLFFPRTATGLWDIISNMKNSSRIMKSGNNHYINNLLMKAAFFIF